MGGGSPGTLTIDAAPTHEELKRILQHGETKARALGLLASSSGTRIGALLKLTESDIDFDKDPVRIYLPAAITKNNKPRVTFMSNEAKDAVKAWIKERDDYLDSAVRKSKSLKCGKDPEDERLFPMSEATANTMWLRLLKKSGLDQKDKSTGIHRLHFHTLRKYFDTNMAAADIPESVIGCLMGHAGYLDRAYKRFDEGKLAYFYKKGVNKLLVFETGEDPEQLGKFEKYKIEQEKKGVERDKTTVEMDGKIVALERELVEVRKENKQIIKAFGQRTQELQLDPRTKEFLGNFASDLDFREMTIRKSLDRKNAKEKKNKQMYLETT